MSFLTKLKSMFASTSVGEEQHGHECGCDHGEMAEKPKGCCMEKGECAHDGAGGASCAFPDSMKEGDDKHDHHGHGSHEHEHKHE